MKLSHKLFVSHIGVAAIGLFMGPQGASEQCRAVPLSETVQVARRRFDTPEGAS